jgi:hypothetical protein
MILRRTYKKIIGRMFFVFVIGLLFGGCFFDIGHIAEDNDTYLNFYIEGDRSKKVFVSKNEDVFSFDLFELSEELIKIISSDDYVCTLRSTDYYHKKLVYRNIETKEIWNIAYFVGGGSFSVFNHTYSVEAGGWYLLDNKDKAYSMVHGTDSCSDFQWVVIKEFIHRNNNN